MKIKFQFKNVNIKKQTFEQMSTSDIIFDTISAMSNIFSVNNVFCENGEN